MPRNRRKIDKSDLPKLNSTQLSLQSFRKWSTNQSNLYYFKQAIISVLPIPFLLLGCLLNVSATVNCLLAIGPLFLNSKTSLLTDVPFLTSYLLLSTNTFSLVAVRTLFLSSVVHGNSSCKAVSKTIL